MPSFPSIAHVAVTVTDLERSTRWYTALFGSEPVLDEDTGPFHHVVWLVGSSLLGIHEHKDAENGTPLWHSRIGNVSNAPTTYMLDGRQYLLVAAGDTLFAFALYE